MSFQGGDQGGSGAGEGIQHNRLWFAVQLDAPARQVEREGAGMVELLRYYVATATSQNWAGSGLIDGPALSSKLTRNKNIAWGDSPLIYKVLSLNS